jgi:triphosphoribosyl-dephospho-CoA synthase
LAAPLASAALDQQGGDLQSRLHRVLQSLTVDDAREAYQAIRAVNPGGLGEAPAHDVRSEPDVTLLEAMRAAQARDRIAWNYTHDFDDIFRLGLKWLEQATERWNDAAWAAARVYLGFLAHVPDTLIERKFGERAAARVREEARPIESGLTE